MSTVGDELRALAKFYDERPNWPVPYALRTLYVWARNAETLARLVRELGSAEKRLDDNYAVGATRRFGDHVTLSVLSPREEVCVKKVVGKRMVEERVIPAHEEEIVEWECPRSLLDAIKQPPPDALE